MGGRGEKLGLESLCGPAPSHFNVLWNHRQLVTSRSTRSCPCSAPGELHTTGPRSFRITFFCQVRRQIRLQSQRHLFPVRYRVDSDFKEAREESDSRPLSLRLSSYSLVKAKEVIFSRARLSRN